MPPPMLPVATGLFWPTNTQLVDQQTAISWSTISEHSFFLVAEIVPVVHIAPEFGRNIWIPVPSVRSEERNVMGFQKFNGISVQTWRLYDWFYPLITFKSVVNKTITTTYSHVAVQNHNILVPVNPKHWSGFRTFSLITLAPLVGSGYFCY